MPIIIRLPIAVVIYFEYDYRGCYPLCSDYFLLDLVDQRLNWLGVGDVDAEL